jgi:uncharacterized membrane protein YeiH
MNLLTVITYSGIFIFAVTGALKARTYKMDVFGAAVIAFVMAYGGGTLRDLLIGIHPVLWINDNIALTLVVLAITATFFFTLNFKLFHRIIFYTDALGIGLYTVAGIERGFQHGLNAEYSVIMGVITATFGGMLVDILCNAIPNLFKPGGLYATACAIGGTIYVIFKHFGFEYNTNLFICVFIVAGIRIYSMRKKFTLPEI